MPDWVAISPFHIEHIISIKHHGTSALDNLAWACLQCNTAKGADVAGYDPDTGDLAPLFHPRRHVWDVEFQLSNSLIIGITPVGRVTVDILQMNSQEQVGIRQTLIQTGRW